MTDTTQNSNPIIFFDGVCGLCNKSVDYIIRKDKKKIFRFASLQSAFASKTLAKHNISTTDLDSVILLHKNILSFKSRAAGRALTLLGGWKSILGKLILMLPSSLADSLYDWVARNRYQWFGQSDSCRIPSEKERSLFLD